MDIEAITTKLTAAVIEWDNTWQSTGDGPEIGNVLRPIVAELSAAHARERAEAMSDVNTVTIARNLLEALIDQHITAHGHTNAIARAAQLSLDRPAPVQVPEGWVHSCAALCTDGIKLWIDACPHCGMPRNAAAPAKEGE